MTTVYVTHPRYIEHEMPGHPEHPGRIQAIWRELDESGVAARMKRIEPDMIDSQGFLNLLVQKAQSRTEILCQQCSSSRLDGPTMLLRALNNPAR